MWKNLQRRSQSSCSSRAATRWKARQRLQGAGQGSRTPPDRPEVLSYLVAQAHAAIPHPYGLFAPLDRANVERTPSFRTVLSDHASGFGVKLSRLRYLDLASLALTTRGDRGIAIRANDPLPGASILLAPRISVAKFREMPMGWPISDSTRSSRSFGDIVLTTAKEGLRRRMPLRRRRVLFGHRLPFPSSSARLEVILSTPLAAVRVRRRAVSQHCC